MIPISWELFADCHGLTGPPRPIRPARVYPLQNPVPLAYRRGYRPEPEYLRRGLPRTALDYAALRLVARYGSRPQPLTRNPSKITGIT